MIGTPDNSITTESVSRLESYLYWKDEFQEKRPLISFPMPYDDWVGHYGDVCQICDGWKVGKFSGNIHYCVCSMLEWLDDQIDNNVSYQSPAATHELKELAPLHTPPDKGDKELQNCINYISKKWLKHPKQWMYMYGGPGSAKTHILQSIRSYLPRGLSIYITAGDFRSKLFAAQAMGGAVDMFVEALATVPILLFDDWGMEYQKLNDWVGTTMENIIDRRVAFPDWFPTIVTSNLSDTEWSNSSDTGHKRTISRLCDPQYSRVFEFTQADFRSRFVQEAIK
jgi:hypothetical protein